MKTMKTKILTILVASLLATVVNASMLKNGDFEKGTSGWKGDKSVDYETDAEGDINFYTIIPT